MSYKISKTCIIKYLFIFGLYSVLFNFYSLPLLDFLDIFIILSVITSIMWIQVSLTFSILIVILLTLITASNINGLLHGLNTNIEHLAFYYKWLFVFFVGIVLRSVFISKSDVLELNRHILLVGAALSIWVIAYTPLRLNGYIDGSWRVSFPFSTDWYASDAHVVSSLLGMILSVNVLNRTIQIYSLPALLFSVAIFLTGSRTGVALLIVASLSILLTRFLSPINITQTQLRSLVFKILFTVTFLVFGYLFIGRDLDFNVAVFADLVNRALNLGIADASSQGRLLKLGVAIDEMSVPGFLLGPGFLQSRLRWYDNGFAILITHGGLLLVIFLGLLFMYLLFKNVRHFAIITQLLLVVLAYTITEQFLISRHVVFIVSLFWISMKLAKSSSAERGNHVS